MQCSQARHTSAKCLCTHAHTHTLNKTTTKWNFKKLYIREFYEEFSSHFSFGYLGKNNTSLGNLNAYLCAPPAHMAYTRVFQLMVHMCLRSPPLQEFCSLKHRSFLPSDVHNLSSTAITVKLMFLTNVYTELINTFTDLFLTCKYCTFISYHQLCLRGLKTHNFQEGPTQSVALLGGSTVLEGTETMAYTSTRSKNKRMSFF